MSDTSGLPNTDSEGVPVEEKPERFETGGDGGSDGGSGQSDTADQPDVVEQPDTSVEDVAAAEDAGSDNAPGGGRDAQAAEPAESEAGQSGDASGDVSEPGETGVAPEGAEDVTTAANSGTNAAEPPPADFDPAQQPSNPDLVKNTEPPD